MDGFEVVRLTHRSPEGPVTKSGREIMEIFEAFDLTGTAWSAAQLTGCDAKTVARYVAVREAGGDPLARARAAAADRRVHAEDRGAGRPAQGEDPGRCGAPEAHRDGLPGVGAVDPAGGRGGEGGLAAGQRRRYRPWIPEPGMWLQWDWGDGPRIGGRKTQLFCAWLAWSRFRVVIPVWDQQLGTPDLVHRPGAARRGRRADLPADRQRADRHHGPRRGDPGAAPGDGRARAGTTAARWRRACRSTPSPRAGSRRR